MLRPSYYRGSLENRHLKNEKKRNIYIKYKKKIKIFSECSVCNRAQLTLSPYHHH